MCIRVVNLRNYVPSENEVLFRIDRQSVVGNPFYMSCEAERDKVCDEYDKYFYNIIASYKINGDINNLSNKQREFVLYLARICNQAKKSDVALGCWCAPKRCHGLTIKKFIEKYV